LHIIASKSLLLIVYNNVYFENKFVGSIIFIDLF